MLLRNLCKHGVAQVACGANHFAVLSPGGAVCVIGWNRETFVERQGNTGVSG